jgi:hypothetical protein
MATNEIIALDYSSLSAFVFAYLVATISRPLVAHTA